MKEKRVVQMTITDRAAWAALGCVPAVALASAGPARAASLQSVIASAGDVLGEVSNALDSAKDAVVIPLTRIESGQLQLALIGFSAVIALVALWLLLRRPPVDRSDEDDVLELAHPLPDLSDSLVRNEAPQKPRLREAVAAMKAEMVLGSAERSGAN